MRFPDVVLHFFSRSLGPGLLETFVSDYTSLWIYDCGTLSSCKPLSSGKLSKFCPYISSKFMLHACHCLFLDDGRLRQRNLVWMLVTPDPGRNCFLGFCSSSWKPFKYLLDHKMIKLYVTLQCSRHGSQMLNIGPQKEKRHYLCAILCKELSKSNWNRCPKRNFEQVIFPQRNFSLLFLVFFSLATIWAC